MNLIDDAKMKMEELSSQQMIDTLKDKQGEEFDQTFLHHMVMHHKSGIEMARLATEKSQNTQITDAAERMAAQQEKDVREMEEMMS